MTKIIALFNQAGGVCKTSLTMNMDAFYTALENGLSESEALRRSQQALITSDESVLAGERGNTATIEIVDQRTGEPLSNSPDLAHPYYWAPFILIGNGL